MKTLTLCLLFLMFGELLSAQSDNSVRSSVQFRKDSLQVLELFKYGYYLESTNLDSAMVYYQKAGKLAKSIDFKDGILKYYSNYTYILNQKGKLKQGLNVNLEALRFAKEKGTKRDVGDCLFNVGSSYNNLGKFDNALTYYLKAADVFKKLNDKPTLILVYDNLGGVYTNSFQYNKALNFHEKARKLAVELKDKKSLAKVFINKGITERFLKKYADAEIDLKYGLKLSEKVENLYLQSIACTNLSELYVSTRQARLGWSYARRANELAVDVKSSYAEFESLKALTTSFAAFGISDSTILYGNKVLKFGKENQFENELYKVYQHLSEAYQQQGNFEKSLEYYKKYKNGSDSLLLQEESVKMQRVQNQFQEAKSENSILNLKASQGKQRQIILYLVLTLVAISIIGLLYFNNLKSKRKLIEQALVSLKSGEDLKAAQIVLETQEQERLRIAKDLHDGMGGLLSGIKLTIQSSPSEENKESALKQLDYAMNEMRRISHSMMPEALSKFGLIDALTDVCKSLNGSGQFDMNYQFFGCEERFSTELETNLYRIILELFNNAIKHSEASHLYLQIIRNNQTLDITVEDNGKGFDTKISHEGIGLKNIASRVKLINGEIDLHSNPGNGTTISITVQL